MITVGTSSHSNTKYGKTDQMVRPTPPITFFYAVITVLFYTFFGTFWPLEAGIFIFRLAGVAETALALAV